MEEIHCLTPTKEVRPLRTRIHRRQLKQSPAQEATLINSNESGSFLCRLLTLFRSLISPLPLKDMSHVMEINALHTKTNFNEINTVVPPPLLMLEATSLLEDHQWCRCINFISNKILGSRINIGCHKPSDNITEITPMGAVRVI